MRLPALVIGFACLASTAGAQTPRPLADLSLEELATIEVTSVSRRPESVADAPAAIYVITPEDIRRSGALTLPEALRLAPTLLVAQIDAGQYAITARGFNGLAANKLLVLVDGRTVGVGNSQLSNDPDYQWMLRSFLALRRGHELDAMVRRVDSLPNPVVPAYTAVDARYAWRVLDGLELSVTGQNLFDDNHPEFNALPGRNEFERSVFAQARWSR